MHIFVVMLIICDEQERKLCFRHLQCKASPFFAYLVIARVKPADVYAPCCTEREKPEQR